MDDAPFCISAADGEDTILVTFFNVGTEYYAACAESDGIVCSCANVGSLTNCRSFKSIYARILTNGGTILRIGFRLFADGDGLVGSCCRTRADSRTLHAGNAGTNAYSSTIGVFKGIPSRFHLRILHIHFRTGTDGYAVLAPYGCRAGITALHTAANGQRTGISCRAICPAVSLCVDRPRSNTGSDQSAAAAFHLEIHVAYIVQERAVKIHCRLVFIRVSDGLITQIGEGICNSFHLSISSSVRVIDTVFHIDNPACAVLFIRIAYRNDTHGIAIQDIFFPDLAVCAERYRIRRGRIAVFSDDHGAGCLCPADRCIGTHGDRIIGKSLCSSTKCHGIRCGFLVSHRIGAGACLITKGHGIGSKNFIGPANGDAVGRVGMAFISNSDQGASLAIGCIASENDSSASIGFSSLSKNNRIGSLHRLRSLAEDGRIF